MQFSQISGGILAYVLLFLFLKNLAELLKNISPWNRKAPPGVVWLLAIGYMKGLITMPFTYGLIGSDFFFLATYVDYALTAAMVALQFYVVIKIADSIAAEYQHRQIYFENKPTFWVGICMAVAYVLIPVTALLLSEMSLFFVAAYFILFIVYWVQTHKVKRILQSLPYVSQEQEEGSIFKDL